VSDVSQSPGPAAGNAADPGSRAFLEAQGFEGFFTVGQLHADRCEIVPNERGVYALVRESLDPPQFMPRSTAPAYRGEDPTRPIEELLQRWVHGAQVLYLGRASGPGVRSLLRQRIKRYLRFGRGSVVGHWDGRFVWQLRDHSALRVAWKPTGAEDPAEVEARLQAGFQRHYGAPPFANLRQQSEG